MKVNILKQCFLIFIFLMISQPCLGSGFGVFTHGAGSLGEGLSTVAHGKNPEIIFYNPALMNELDGTLIEGTFTIIVPNYDYFSSILDSSTSTKSATYFPGALYVTRKYNDKISAGIGVFSPFGLGTEWNQDWEGRFITTKAEMQTLNFNPAVSYQFLPSISIAAGIDFMLVKATLKNQINFSSIGLSEGQQKFDGDGTGLGFNLGLYADMGKGFSFGVSYRSEIETDIDGDVDFQLPSPVLQSLFPNTKGETTITFPQQLHIAVAYRGFYRLTIEAGVRWEGWSSYDTLDIQLEEEVNGSTRSTTPQNWDDTFSILMGGRYNISDRLALLAGYIHGNDPIPGSTFSPVIPDSSSDAWTCGLEIDFNKYRVGLSYSLQTWEKRYKSNEVGSDFSGGTITDARANGSYEGKSHFISTSLIYKF